MSSDYRHHRAIIDATDAGHIHRDPHTYEYVDRRNRLHNITPTVYLMEDRGWLRLYIDGRIEVTDAGRAWRNRSSKPAPADPFATPGVAA
ncbi:hypothetical protein ABZ949_02545 [Micromonospora tulbaghiae]|uniref:hypothetical protein n=1 Tax=Micromonospora tulbaghiae TaxID=479978 RepID=UPI0033D041A5